MNELMIVSFGISGMFLILAMIFFIFKERACMLISGYNFKTKEERKNYDEIRMSKDYMNYFLVCCAIFIVGGIGSIVMLDYCFWITIIVFLVYFFKHVGFNDRVFDKYKK